MRTTLIKYFITSLLCCLYGCGVIYAASPPIVGPSGIKLYPSSDISNGWSKYPTTGAAYQKVDDLYDVTDTDAALDYIYQGGSQYGRPISGVANSGGCSSGSYLSVDETVADDSDYISCNGSGSEYTTLGVTDLSSLSPNSDYDHTIRFRIKNPFGSATDSRYTTTVELLQSSTVIATYSVIETNNNFSTYQYTLTTAEASAITDYSLLRVRVTKEASPSSFTVLQLSWVELQLPTAPKYFEYYVTPTTPYNGLLKGIPRVAYLAKWDGVSSTARASIKTTVWDDAGNSLGVVTSGLDLYPSGSWFQSTSSFSTTAQYKAGRLKVRTELSNLDTSVYTIARITVYYGSTASFSKYLVASLLSPVQDLFRKLIA